MADGLVLWDFDGTLAWRAGLWSGCVMEVLDELEQGHAIAIDTVRLGLRNSFPWDCWSEPHPQLCEADGWWEQMRGRIARTLQDAGIGSQRAELLAVAVRERYLDVTIAWELFDDTLPALRALAERGWRNVVLSNHVPELVDLISGLGLGGDVDEVFSSAATGFEKPHPQAFRLALEACGNPHSVWMVGDNPHADIEGAEALGIPAILVRSEGPARHRSSGLAGAVELIVGGAATAAMATPTA